MKILDTETLNTIRGKCLVLHATTDELMSVFGHIDALEEAIGEAVNTGIECGDIDGAHHKQWVIDQMLRKLLGDAYAETIKDASVGPDGSSDYYDWDEGIAP